MSDDAIKPGDRFEYIGKGGVFQPGAVLKAAWRIVDSAWWEAADGNGIYWRLTFMASHWRRLPAVKVAVCLTYKPCPACGITTKMDHVHFCSHGAPNPEPRPDEAWAEHLRQEQRIAAQMRDADAGDVSSELGTLLRHKIERREWRSFLGDPYEPRFLAMGINVIPTPRRK